MQPYTFCDKKGLPTLTREILLDNDFTLEEEQKLLYLGWVRDPLTWDLVYPILPLLSDLEGRSLALAKKKYEKEQLRLLGLSLLDQIIMEKSIALVSYNMRLKYIEESNTFSEDILAKIYFKLRVYLEKYWFLMKFSLKHPVYTIKRLF